MHEHGEVLNRLRVAGHDLRQRPHLRRYGQIESIYLFRKNFTVKPLNSTIFIGMMHESKCILPLAD